MKTPRFPKTVTLGVQVSLVLLGIIWFVPACLGSLAGPYTADASTLHLWHLDETSVPCVDSVSSGGTNLVDLAGGATLGNPAFSVAFGNSLNTAAGGVAKSDLLAASPSAGNVTITLANSTNGAFTFEALVWIGFDPTVSSTSAYEIMAGESGTTANRIFQWRLAPVGFTLAAGIIATNPCMTFENVRAGSGSQATIYGLIPTTGPDAILSNQWYHVAVTYNGVPSTAGNLTMYWTLLNPSRTSADPIQLISATKTLTGLNPLSTVTTTFMLGNQGRSKNGNFLGSIDEVRISSVARNSVQMMYTSTALNWATQPTNQFVPAGSTVTLVSLAGGEAPSYQWQFNGTNIAGATNANLVLTNISYSQAGSYTAVATNSTSSIISSNAQIVVGSGFREIYNTGINTNGALLVGGAVDPHWQMTFSGDPNFPGPNAVVIGNPPASYLPDGLNSMWIAPVASGSAAGSVDFDYTITFLLDTADPTTAVLNGSWGADNFGIDILLNGVSVGLSCTGFAALTTFTITNGYVHAGLDTNGNPITITNYFQPGLNTLECITSNAPSGGDNPTAFRAEVSGLGLALPPSAPQVLNAPQNETNYVDQNASFAVVATGSPPLTYQWYFGTNNLAGQTNRTLFVSNLSATNAGTYTVIVSNPVSTASASATLTVQTPPLLAWIGTDPVNPSFWDEVSTNWVDTNGVMATFAVSDDVVFDDRGTNTTTINLIGALTPNAVLFNSTTNYIFTSTSGGSLAGTAVLTVTNTGLLVLDTSNNYSGPTTIAEGTLQVGNADASGTLGTGPVTDNGTLVFDRVDTVNIANTISGTGSVVVAGGGVVALSGNNSYSGPTLVSLGTLSALNGSALGTSSVSVSNGAVLDIPEDINLGNVALTIAGSGPSANGALYHDGGGSGNIFGGPITLSDNAQITLGANATLNLTNLAGISSSNLNLTLMGIAANSQGVISGPIALSSGSLNVNGSGTWVLTSTSNSWTGGTEVNSGILQIGDGGPDGSLGPGQIDVSGTLIFNSSNNLVLNQVLNINNDVTFSGAGNYVLNSQLGGGGTLTNNGTGTLQVTTNNAGNFSGNVSVSGSGFLKPLVSGALGNGALNVGAAQADTCSVLLPGNVGISNTIFIYPRAFGSANNPAHFINQAGTNILSPPSAIVIPIGGNLLSFESDTGKLSVVAEITAEGAARNLVLKGAGTGEIMGNIDQIGGGDSQSIWKLDSGTWTLWGTNTPAGPTTVSNGTLVIEGSMDTNEVTVAGGTLTGTGVIAGPVLVNAGGTISPGPGIGTLSLSNTLTLQPGSTTLVDLNAGLPANGAIAGATAISYGGTLVATNLGGAFALGQSFTLFSASAYAGAFSKFQLPPLSSGLAWDTADLAVNGSISISNLTRPTVSASLAPGSTNFIMSGAKGVPGLTFSVLASTNVLAPLTNWSLVQTGNFDANGNFIVTNGITSGMSRRFFIMRTP